MKNPRVDYAAPKVLPSDVEVYVGRIQWHARRIQKPGTSASERLIRLRSIISAAEDAYEKELEQLEALNFVKADPDILPGVPVG